MMSDSDDEPLSTLAVLKQQNLAKFTDLHLNRKADNQPEKIIKKRKKKSVTSGSLSKVLKNDHSSNVVPRPDDAWMYLKDLKPTGPYSCLLCSEWFINRSKMVLHYIVNHRKDFCGICRYFVPDRETWLEHTKIHQPHPCPKCINVYETEPEIAYHLATVHELTHCPLCHFMVSTSEYITHLSNKHAVKSPEYASQGVNNNICEFIDNKTKFKCLLCGKVNSTHNYFNHFGCFHHITLKCFSQLLSGFNLDFNVSGAQLSKEFMENVLGNVKYGYINIQNPELANDINLEVTVKLEIEPNTDENEKLGVTYEGTEDIDITSLELIPIHAYYCDYIEQSINDVNIFKIKSYLDYEDLSTPCITCPICNFKLESVIELSQHCLSLHGVQMKSIFNCRVCTWGFNTKEELHSHVKQEIAEFDDLWLCQFCDKEFDGRQPTREHLADHVDMIEVDNCFSPHLGFKCKFCPTLFWNEVDREGHEKCVHYTENSKECYRCEICGDLFSDLLFFVHHLTNTHEEDTTGLNFIFKCLICCSIQKDIESMRVHFFCNHPDATKTYCTLDDCRYKPVEKKNFKVHLRCVHKMKSNSNSEALKCTLCSEEFDGKRARSTHMARMHGRGKFICKICNLKLQSNDERKLHYLLNHPGHHPFECTICHKSFLYKSSLYSHRAEHTMAPTFKCEYCGKTFVKKDSYREHLLIHAGPTHSCSYCPMVFVQRSNMLRHERRHTGERPYSCDHCGRTFSDKGACTSHCRTHTNNETYQCVYCGQSFVQKSKLKYHIRKHTGENLETCTVCSKRFTSACSLREHMKTHITSDVAVKCPICNRHYRDDRTMIRHLRTTHKNSNLPCPLCDKKLNNISNLKYHVLRHSKSNMFSCKFCTNSYACRRSMTRHLMKRHTNELGEKPVLKDFYRILDVRELNLGLDEETLTKLFGSSRVGNFGAGTSDDEIQPIDHVNIKMEKHSDEDNFSNDGEFEPTDFVSVKIEPVDEDT